MIFDLIVEIAAIVSVLALWILVAATYSELPDVIPVHYDATGQADAYGDKSKILELPVIATVLYAGLTILSRFPQIFNYPVRITENNASMQYRNAARMLRCVKFSIVLIFGGIVLQTIRNVGGHTEGLGTWSLPVTLAIIFVPVIYFGVKSFLYR